MSAQEPVTPVDPRQCPLCGSGNACGLAEGASTCWCFDTAVSAEALQRVPAEARDRACLCRGCATGEGAPAETLTAIRAPARGR